MIYKEPRYLPGGDRYMLIEFGNEMNLELNFMAQGLASAIEKSRNGGVIDEDHDAPGIPSTRTKARTSASGSASPESVRMAKATSASSCATTSRAASASGYSPWMWTFSRPLLTQSKMSPERCSSSWRVAVYVPRFTRVR